nr:hypothetical protein [uncultured Rhodopila sp.]
MTRIQTVAAAERERIAQWHERQGRIFTQMAREMETRPHQAGELERFAWAGASHAAHANAIRMMKDAEE